MLPWDSEKFSQLRSPDGNREPAPIIVGVARSGTTLLRLMLDAHSELAVTHEAGFVPNAINLINPFSRMFYVRLKNSGWHVYGGDGLREELFRIITEFGNWNDFHLSRPAFKQALIEIEPFSLSEGIRAFFRLYAQRFGKSRWGDKTPFYLRHLRNIEKALPEAHFIHLIRDGRDAAVSGKGLPFVANNIEAIARNWAGQIITARKQGRHCRHYIEVRFEDLILETTGILQKICVFINVNYEPQMEHYYYHNARERLNDLGPRYDENGSVLVSKESRLYRHRLTLQSPEPGRIGRWKTEMTKAELTAFNRIAGPLLAKLGYET